MTEAQMRERIREINEECDKLRNERYEYEKYFSDKADVQKKNDHIKCVGKHYALSTPHGSRFNFIKAFKIIEILDQPNADYALCLTLVRGVRNTCFQELGIQLETLPLWTFNINRMMAKEPDPKVIDFFHEISAKEFNELVETHLAIMKKNSNVETDKGTV